MKIANNWGSITIKLGIGCVICLLLGAAILLYAQDEKKAEFIGTKPEMDAAKMKEMAAVRRQAMAQAPEQPQQQRNRTWGRQNRGGDGVDFGENAVFYKIIIDNNLFRPLGWTPPNNEPSYSLVSTAVDSDSNGVISQATLLERRSNRYHFVTIGTELDGMIVKDIQDKRVIMDKAGETVTLRTGDLQLLSTKRGSAGNRGGERSDDGSERADNNNAGRNRGNQAANRNTQTERREQDETAQRRRREMMERFRNASGEERRRMIERFRGDRGRRGRGRD